MSWINISQFIKFVSTIFHFSNFCVPQVCCWWVEARWGRGRATRWSTSLASRWPTRWSATRNSCSRTRWTTSTRCVARGPSSSTASSGTRTAAFRRRAASSSTRPCSAPSTPSTRCAPRRPTRSETRQRHPLLTAHCHTYFRRFPRQFLLLSAPKK